MSMKAYDRSLQSVYEKIFLVVKIFHASPSATQDFHFTNLHQPLRNGEIKQDRSHHFCLVIEKKWDELFHGT